MSVSLAEAAAARRAKILARGTERMALLMNGQTQLPPATNESPVTTSLVSSSDAPLQTPEPSRSVCTTSCDDVPQRSTVDSIKLLELARQDRTSPHTATSVDSHSTNEVFQFISSRSYMILFCSGVMSVLLSHFALLPVGILTALFLTELLVRTNDVVNLSTDVASVTATPTVDDDNIDESGSAVESSIESVLSKSLPPQLISLLDLISTLIKYATAIAAVLDDVCAFIVAVIITQSIIALSVR